MMVLFSPFYLAILIGWAGLAIVALVIAALLK